MEPFKKLEDEQLSKRRKERDLTPQNMHLPFVMRFLRHPKLTAEHKSTFCRMANQTVTSPVWLAEYGLEIKDRCSMCRGTENLAHWMQGCPDDPPMEGHELHASIVGYTNEALAPSWRIPHQQRTPALRGHVFSTWGVGKQARLQLGSRGRADLHGRLSMPCRVP